MSFVLVYKGEDLAYKGEDLAYKGEDLVFKGEGLTGVESSERCIRKFEC